MAFLYKEKKFKAIMPVNDSEIGPGQYISPTVKRYIRQNVAPFCSSKTKDYYVSDNKKCDFPGPGKYFQDDFFLIKNNKTLGQQKHLETMNKERVKKPPQKIINTDYSSLKINTSKEQNNDNITYNYGPYNTNYNTMNKEDNNRNNINIDEAKKFSNTVGNFQFKSGKNKHPEKIGFSCQDKRFKEIKDDFVIPGPGYYYKDKKNKYKTTDNSCDNNYNQSTKGKKVYLNTGFEGSLTIANLKSKFSTIPSKENMFGYEILKDGNVLARENPLLYKTFSGEKNDAVGPGTYNVMFPETWHRTGSQWSSYKTQRLIPLVTKQIKRKEINKKIMNNIISHSNPPKKTIEESIFTNEFIFNNNNRKDIELNENGKMNFKNFREYYKFKNADSNINPHNFCKTSYFDDAVNSKKFIPGPGYYFDNMKSTGFNTEKSPGCKMDFMIPYYLKTEDGSNENKMNENYFIYDDSMNNDNVYNKNRLNTKYDIKFLNKLKQKFCTKSLHKDEKFRKLKKEFFNDVPIPIYFNLPSDIKKKLIKNFNKKKGEESFRLTPEKDRIAFNTTKNRFSDSDILNKNQENDEVKPKKVNKILKDQEEINRINKKVYKELEINPYLIKTFNAKLEGFGFKEKRFNNNAFNKNNVINKDKVPGPGTYINPYSAAGTMNTVFFKGRNMTIEDARKLDIRKSEKTPYNVVHESNPPVGLYNPQIPKTIQYKVLKNASNKYNVPFDGHTYRNLYINNNAFVGPGSYNLDKKKEFKENKVPFKTKEIRENIMADKIARNIKGPGNYDLDISYPWYKKEFNAIYLEEQKRTLN